MVHVVQGRRRQEIEVKVQQTQEIEKAAAIQERKDLFEQRKTQKSRIARLEGQMEVVAMVSADRTPLGRCVHVMVVVCVLQWMLFVAYNQLLMDMEHKHPTLI